MRLVIHGGSTIANQLLAKVTEVGQPILLAVDDPDGTPASRIAKPEPRLVKSLDAMAAPPPPYGPKT